MISRGERLGRLKGSVAVAKEDADRRPVRRRDVGEAGWPLKSASTTELGYPPAAKLLAARKVPSPLPKHANAVVAGPNEVFAAVAVEIPNGHGLQGPGW